MQCVWENYFTLTITRDSPLDNVDKVNNIFVNNIFNIKAIKIIFNYIREAHR